ncbi:bifunctional proline dehydrogenase/L-glutamate gamma-semialdehyde dehydrogenase PutA [Erythrobacter sp. CCH5-A1]|jgi:RHH-type proline utilization regulon transcriptional repressor/proline dehydrogenase/delta 1-pyrroline-5-carboxylate dehydrogenase|uniref:bifunctional proline dehydrogenase/L-glutamate gamma-semialdehyde dehydrogenase PutA n=1 Tax=Erythrobacter sp. CCH5-A1 TaxID=1768792 RepID=UPI00082E11E0|nr:bifunctional proline dehydrogenase/L-glutamate gamma-semialdehyde dehydrogenase PutA [Erythrobacter sp. CCH5-A1]
MADYAPAPAIDRTDLRRAYRQDEEAAIAERLEQAAPAAKVHAAAAGLAVRLIEGARAKKASGIDAFLQQYGLDTEEGIALMCLAEALLRVPDAATADALIKDKIGQIDWGEHLGESSSTFVNAATFSLMLTGEVLDPPDARQKGLGSAFRRAMNRLGEPVIRTATGQAMKILGGQFVFGRTIDEALKRAAPERSRGITHSFDMLGEAAMTFADAEKYRLSYEAALARLAREAGAGVAGSPGISVKLSALHPKYNFFHADEAKAEMVPVIRDLAVRARDADIHFTIDAEEAERLELSMDIIEELVADDDLFRRPDGSRWEGFGLAIQAYSKRGIWVCDWAGKLARRHGRKLFVRLVKGAYWDSEVKLSQVGGYTDYPVFTRKVATDVSYLACAARLFEHADVIRPAFATHNAYTIGAIKHLAAGRPFEFQRLHGMGEEVYDALHALEGNQRTPVRTYAPVGGHKELLAYLVRRLLENGANTSFVNRLGAADIPAEELVGDPVAELAALSPRRNPAIPLPGAIFGARKNSAGVDLSDPLVREPLLAELRALEARQWSAEPTFGGTGAVVNVTSPHDPSQIVGTRRDATAQEVEAAFTRAAQIQPGWDALGGEARALLLENAADLFEAHTAEFLSLCQREAGKTLLDSVLELREAVDFLRYYAAEARRQFSAPTILPGPTGEENSLTLHGRGVFATISPWNFPLAIFIGMASAALAAGNAVIAKPAEQTPLIAALAVKLCHEAGIPPEALQLLPGAGEVGQLITADPRLAGVAFTGSTETARAINRALANRDGPIATLIAETGGQNAMIVDSSALPEQVVRDVLASSFQSAGQRCSALRVLYLQEDIAEGVLEMIRGGFAALTVGDPADLATDVGPVIDADAQALLEAHVADCMAKGLPVERLPGTPANGHFVAPTIIEIPSIRDLKRENFGPVLHVVRFRAGELGQVVDAINATGFGLTLGLHSRIAETRRFVQGRARVGNFYVNRNQIGAVVESQPFGGEGLSGTGPKAGGPHYLARFATERVTCIDTTAAGGNASLLAAG